MNLLIDYFVEFGFVSTKYAGVRIRSDDIAFEFIIASTETFLFISTSCCGVILRLLLGSAVPWESMYLASV